MKKSITLLILCVIIHSCGKRTTAKEYHRFEVDSISQEKAHVIDSNINFSNVFTLTPYDPLKPIKMNGIEYFNTIIVFDKSITKAVKVEDKQKDLSYKSSEVVKKKETEKTDYSNIWIGIVLVIGFIFILYNKIPTFKK